MTKNERVLWIDHVKFICIFFVIASHLGNHSIAPLLRAFYTPFFLSGFLMASGYTYRHRRGFGKHLKKKFFQLLIPWFCFSMLTRIIAQLRTFGMGKFIEDIKWNFLQIRGKDDGMWFVAALFVAYVPFYFFIEEYEKVKENGRNQRSIEKHRRIFFFISVALIFLYYLYINYMPSALFPWGKNALPWHIEYIPYALGCMFTGYVLKEKYESTLETLINKTQCFWGLILLYFVAVYLPIIEGYEFSSFFKCIYSLILCLLGIVFVSCISKAIKLNALFTYAGRNTLVYFGMQGKLLFVLETTLKKISKNIFSVVTGDPVLSILYSLMMGLILTVILTIPAIIINRYFPFMVGKKRTDIYVIKR